MKQFVTVLLSIANVDKGDKSFIIGSLATGHTVFLESGHDFSAGQVVLAVSRKYQSNGEWKTTTTITAIELK
jgi:hypothetical protein